MRNIIGVINMEEKEINQDSKKSLWTIGSLGVAIYLLGYVAGIKQTEKVVSESYNRGVIDTFQHIIFK
jgi:hypothetical protein